jgi:hypothetical protein
MDFKSGLFLFYIVLFAPYFEKMISCDLQRFLTESVLAKHMIAYITAFFVIILAESEKEKNDATMLDYLKTTTYIYLLFVLSTKAKAIFIFPVIILLVLDQVLKTYTDVEIKKKIDEKGANTNQLEEQENIYETARTYISYTIYALIIGGFISYYFRQRAEFGNSFSTYMFMVGTFKCKGLVE